jgi:hypothetical protein
MIFLITCKYYSNYYKRKWGLNIRPTDGFCAELRLVAVTAPGPAFPARTTPTIPPAAPHALKALYATSGKASNAGLAK